MYCKKCGKQIADDALFCNFCGSPQVPSNPVDEALFGGAQKPASLFDQLQELEPKTDTLDMFMEEPARTTGIDEFNWNVNGYPDANATTKTEDVDFNWNMNPNEVTDKLFDSVGHKPAAQPEPEISIPEAVTEADIFGNIQTEAPRSASEKIDKFYTFNRKNEEFQQLLNREYDKVKKNGALGAEMNQASQQADYLFENREIDNSMEAFLAREGVEQPYQPKAFESDVLARIEAQEKARELQRLEEEARRAAIEEERLKAEIAKRAEEERKAAEEAARIKAEEERRAAEEARRAAEEAARIKAEQEAELARIKAAEEEARIREQQQEAMRLKAEQEAQARLAEEAKKAEEARIAEELRQKAEAQRLAEEEAMRKLEEENEAKRQAAAEEARLKAEEELRNAQREAKIKAQLAARQAALEQEAFEAEQARRAAEEAALKNKLENDRNALANKADREAAAREADAVLRQTAQMAAEEQAKIRAALAGYKEEPAPVVEPVVEAAPETVDSLIEELKTAEPVYEAPQVMEEPAPALSPAVNERVEEAHRATLNKINEMAKARDEFFAAFDDIDDAPTNVPVEPARPVTERAEMLDPAIDHTETRYMDRVANPEALDATRRISKQELKNQEKLNLLAALEAAQARTVAAQEEARAAKEALANAEAEVKAEEEALAAALAQIEPEVPAEPVVEEVPVIEEIPAIEEIPEIPEIPEIEEIPEDILAEIPAIEEIPEIEEEAEEPATLESLLGGGTIADLIPDTELEDAEATAEAYNEAAADESYDDLNELLSQFATLNESMTNSEPMDFPEILDPSEIEIPEEGGAVPSEEPNLTAEELAALEPETESPGLKDTMVIPTAAEELPEEKPAFDFDSYGVEEAANYRRQQAAANFEPEDDVKIAKPRKEAPKVELPDVEAAAEIAAAADDEEEEEEKGGVGRTILKILLVLLIIVFVVELAGIGIRFFAPDSSAAQFIDTQITNVMSLITGDTTINL